MEKSKQKEILEERNFHTCHWTGPNYEKLIRVAENRKLFADVIANLHKMKKALQDERSVFIVCEITKI